MRPRALIVDDEKAFADILAELLEDEGYVVLRARDGVSAIQLLAASGSSIDLMLCDVMLPGMRGDQVAAEVRRLFPGRRLPIILLSASADPRITLRDVWFLCKPLEISQLMSLLEDLVPRGQSAARTLQER